MMSNILITTLGVSWQIVPELWAFLNPGELPLFNNKPNLADLQGKYSSYQLEPVQELWIITTDGQKGLDKVKQWFEAVAIPEKKLRIFILKGVTDLLTDEHCHYFTDLTYRSVLHANTRAAGSKVYLSLAGGRKTMSADMQEAAHLFGCDALFHLVAGSVQPWMQNDDIKSWLEPLTLEQASQLSPLIVSTNTPASPLLSIDPEINPNTFPLTWSEDENYVVPSTTLYTELSRRLQQSQSLISNLYRQILKNSNHQPFYTLLSLSPAILKKLQTVFIGTDLHEKEKDLAWLKRLPKADLHCHLGGILEPDDLAEVVKDIVLPKPLPLKINEWLSEVQSCVSSNNLQKLKELVPETKQLRGKFNWPEPFTVVAFLQQFAGKQKFLSEFIYGPNPGALKGIGIKAFESLGDLQGSGLLQNEELIRKTLNILKRKVQEENICYLELRCSPINYIRGGLSAREVVQIIMEELGSFEPCLFKLIFIASRHNKMSIAWQHIELYQELKDNPTFQCMFVGFDLAGDESEKAPREMRDAFLPLLADCINITIHAGEDRPVENIWEAAYFLNADRIGHGLTLLERKELLRRFIDKKIALEMCPASNDLITGYKNYLNPGDAGTDYPLKQYLDEGLLVTINTDDPGMCRSSLSQNYYTAASLTQGGLSQWEILQIIKNGFRSAFCSFEERQKLLREAGIMVEGVILESQMI